MSLDEGLGLYARQKSSWWEHEFNPDGTFDGELRDFGFSQVGISCGKAG